MTILIWKSIRALRRGGQVASYYPVHWLLGMRRIAERLLLVEALDAAVMRRDDAWHLSPDVETNNFGLSFPRPEVDYGQRVFSRKSWEVSQNACT